MFNQFTGLIWFLLTLMPLIILQRILHREIQSAIFIASGGNAKLTMALYSILFFPGVLIHELSHFLAAKLLRVPTRNFSVIPKMMPGGYLRMGYVEVAETDIFRDSMIGVAPLVLGNLIIAFIAIEKLHLTLIWDVLRNGQLDLFWLGISLLPNVPDFAVWFYLTFTISSTMLPSRSDRHAWLPLGLLMVVLISLGGFAGAGTWMVENLAPPLNIFLQSVATLFGLTAVLHGIIIPPILIIHKLLSRWLGWDIG
ncbi:MAG: hypothetical protein QGM50_03920 [Anaerolineae bacterium]|nr:hypothetical protein [Anaerolineae bacterium]MDK1081361.1 hypothetical protein [Anaerolineae bacterium]MDK1117920.1 hypothetical protein [Anaerolineae bacterium]